LPVMAVFTVGYRGEGKSTVQLHARCYRYGPMCWRNCKLNRTNCVYPEKKKKNS